MRTLHHWTLQHLSNLSLILSAPAQVTLKDYFNRCDLFLQRKHQPLDQSTWPGELNKQVRDAFDVLTPAR